MKKGFTLVELLGTITILGVIMLIVSPIARNIINDSKEELYEVQVSNIEDALKNWAVDNSRLLPENEGETITITLGQLKAGGYVEAELRNPKNNKCFGNDMLLTVTRHQKNYIYNVEDESSTETTTCDEYLKPYIILNGDAIVYVEVGEEYVDLGASAIGTDGVDISSSITTSISGSRDTIDTSVVGNSYTITYKITEGDNTTSIKRKVIVNDTIHPEFTIPDNVVLEIGDTSLNLMEGVTATDNSDSSGTSVNITTKSNISFGIPGEYIITYIATDSSGNKVTKKRVVEIIELEKTLAGLATTGTFAYGYGMDVMINEVDECAKKGQICTNGTNGTQPTAFAIKVNSNQTYKFYVMSDNGEKVTLIMDRNVYPDGNTIEGDVAWISANDYGEKDGCGWISCNNKGPLTSLLALKERTSDWTYIPKFTYVLENDADGLGGNNTYPNITNELVTDVRARLPRLNELNALGCTTTTCPWWLIENLNGTGDDNTGGYRTSTVRTNGNNNSAWYVDSFGKVDKYSAIWNANHGIRPVITLSK